MARPRWGKGTAFWITCTFIAAGSVAFVVGWGEPRLAQQQSNHAAPFQPIEDVRANGDRVAKEIEKQRKVNEQIVQEQLAIVGQAYQKASDQLGRPPQTADELTPFLPPAEGLVFPMDLRQFEFAWGTPLTDFGRLLAWEKAARQDGGRVALISGGEPQRVTADQFKILSGTAEPGATADRPPK